MTSKQESYAFETKKKIVENLSNLIKNKKTVLIASIKNIPGSQFQEISKKLRSKAIIKVPKKNLIFRALDSSENETIKKLKEQIKDNVAILFSNLDCYDLAGELIANKSPSKAKTGQEALEDIEIQAGPTDLVPGPAISELGALGIQIQIEKGKIHIKEPKVIVKKGEKISQNAAGIMSKLDIKPFSIGFIPLAVFDVKQRKLYTEININKEGEVKNLKVAFGKALSFAVEIGYVCEDTIKFLIGKAGMHEKVLEKLIKEDSPADADNDKTEVKDETKDSLDNSKNQFEPLRKTNTLESKSKEENK